MTALTDTQVVDPVCGMTITLEKAAGHNVFAARSARSEERATKRAA